jgi:hypothetical protein
MEPTDSAPRRSNRLQGLQPDNIIQFDPFGNDVLTPEPINTPNPNSTPMTMTKSTPQQPKPEWSNDDNSSVLLSYDNSSPSLHPHSDTSPFYATNSNHTPSNFINNDNYLMNQSVSHLQTQVSQLTSQLDSLLHTPNYNHHQNLSNTHTSVNNPDPPSSEEHINTTTIANANNSQTTSSRPSKPDPPEDSYLPFATTPKATPIIAHATVPDPYLKTSFSLPPSKLPPSRSSTFNPPTPTIPVHIPTPPDSPILEQAPPQTIPSSTPVPPTIIYPKDIKLTLSSYKQGHNYLKWKRLCLVEISCNTKYTDIVTTSNNELHFNEDMSIASSRALFLATTKALGSLVDNYVSSSDIGLANGFTLWKTLDQSEINKESTLVQRQSLIRNFATITKHRNETIEQYTTRFETKLDELRIKNLTTPSEPELVCQYISSLKLNKIFGDTLRKFDEATWYQNQSWIQIMIWCKNEISV